jgi:DnaJ-class molecular chaperone
MSQATYTVTQITCRFCKGTGRDPFDLLSELAICQVCEGTGKVRIEEPAIPCACCKGTGVYHGTRITCTICKGKGMVTAPKGLTEQCPECKGTGTAADSGLPCLECKGKGIVSGKEAHGQKEFEKTGGLSK